MPSTYKARLVSLSAAGGGAARAGEASNAAARQATHAAVCSAYRALRGANREVPFAVMIP
jgi:hypothetical protein